MGLQRFPVKDYTGGVNLQDGPVALEPNEAQDARNCVVSNRGVLSQRLGKVRLDVKGFPSEKRVDHMRSWYHGSTRVLMLSINGTVYYMNTSGEVKELLKGTAGTVWCFEQMEYNAGAGYKDYLWMMNGTDKAKKWDGEALSDWAGKPPNGTMIRSWKNSMCISGVAAFPQRLFFSDIANPEAPEEVTDGGYGSRWIDIRTSEDDLDPLTWLEILADSLIVFKRRSTQRIFDPTSFAFNRIADIGCEDRFQSAVIADRAYFFNRSGVYSVQSVGASRYESLNLQPMWDGTSDALTINQGALAKVRLASTRDRRLAVAVPTHGSATNNILLEALPDLLQAPGRRGSKQNRLPWMIHTYPVSSLCTFRSANVDELVAGAADDDEIHRLFTGTNDDGAAIESYYFMSYRGLITEEPIERLRRINVELAGRVRLEVFNDFQDSVKFTKLLESDLDAHPEWNDGLVWDDGLPWDPITGVVLVRARPETRARYHAVKLSNGELNQSWQIYTMEFAFRGGKEHTK